MSQDPEKTPANTFPLLWPYRREERDAWKRLGCPESVPWSFVAPHEKHALHNHSQTLKRLAERGGLSPAELVAVVDEHDVFWVMATTSLLQIPRLLELLEAATESRVPKGT